MHIGNDGPMTMKSLRKNNRNDPSLGICANCVHNGHCVFQRTAGGPVTFCEEHETEPALEAVRISVRQEITIPFVPGLCGTCDHLNTCVLRSKDHITYHCEHYR